MARNPKQDANLKPIQKGQLSKEEAKKRGSAGGKKSGEARRTKRDAKQSARYMLELAAKNQLAANLTELGVPVNDQTNMMAMQARLFTMAMSGNLNAYTTLMKMAGYDPEEERRERESLASDKRRDMEVEYKRNALGGGIDGARVAVNAMDEDGDNDVVIYLPAIQDEKNLVSDDLEGVEEQADEE